MATLFGGMSSRFFQRKDTISVYIADNHNEVLEGIYREIGRKRLPMTGCLLLHLDSHSDLSIPKVLTIDDVFDKDLLFSTLSIENWIVPAVFAGHIDAVVWIRPPWTKESFDRFSTFSVGHHIASGEIRVSSKSNYFLSELSFAPEEEMAECKPLNLYVIPFSCEVAMEKREDCLSSSPKASCSDSSEKNGDCLPSFSKASCPDSTEKSGKCIPSSSKASCHDSTEKSGKCIPSSSKASCPDSTEKSEECLPSSSKVNCHDSEFPYQTVTKVVIADATSSRVESKSDQKQDISNESYCERDPNASTATSIPNGSQNLVDSADKLSDAGQRSSNKSTSETDEIGCCNSISEEIDKILQGRSDRFILDIDLDFFSTADPLLAMLTPEQRNLFRALYRFTPPVDRSDESISDCVTQREEQITYLKTVMMAAQSKETLELGLGDSQRDQWLKELLPDLMKLQESESVDFEWLHEIGTGIDDCRLPHHISQQEEIRSMVDGVEAMLHKLPKPTVITIARSSFDEYCPVHQVDFIETCVLQMLHRVYASLDLKYMS